VVIPIDRSLVPFDPDEYGAVGTIMMEFLLQKSVQRDPVNSGALSVRIYTILFPVILSDCDL
jgi:hypothetical protein